MPPDPGSHRRVDEEIHEWDSDHTALVHVLWEAERDGLSLGDADHLAQHIMGSGWMRAVKRHAHDRPAERVADVIRRNREALDALKRNGS